MNWLTNFSLEEPWICPIKKNTIYVNMWTHGDSDEASTSIQLTLEALQCRAVVAVIELIFSHNIFVFSSLLSLASV